jgi:manganese transport protein
LCREVYPRWACYALWVLCEIAITATDLAEVIGTAIGLNLLFGIPVILGVIITAADTLLFLLIQHFGIRKLELFIFGLLATVSSCFIIELFIVKPELPAILNGFIPRIDGESIYVAIGIIGATVMPHNFYLHSSLVQSRKIVRTPGNLRQAFWYNLIDCALSLNIAFFVNSAILIVAARMFFPTHTGSSHKLHDPIFDPTS